VLLAVWVPPVAIEVAPFVRAPDSDVAGVAAVHAQPLVAAALLLGWAERWAWLLVAATGPLLLLHGA
jgi:hypothetical protein